MNSRETEAGPLKAIGYVSHAATPVGSSALAALEAEAREHNVAAGITGLLVFDAGCYAQVLEGPADAVDATFARIRGDRRHQDLEQVLDTPISERSFPHWALASIDLRAPAASSDVFELPGGLADFLARNVGEAPQGNELVLVNAFKQVLELLDKAQGAGEKGRD